MRFGNFQIVWKELGRGWVSWKTNAGAASGVGSIRMIGVLVGVYHFDL
jgi:hypothetical protein